MPKNTLHSCLFGGKTDRKAVGQELKLSTWNQGALTLIFSKSQASGALYVAPGDLKNFQNISRYLDFRTSL